MGDNTTIEWTDATWNPIVGCSVISPGCTNCYAMRLAGTRMLNHLTRKGLTVATKAGPVWNGEVRFNEAALLEPLRWRRPRRIFVGAHTDIFHDAVPDAWLGLLFAVMALCPQHTFQILTKRPDRMREYFRERERPVADPMYALLHGPMMARVEQTMQIAIDATFPLPNVWLGVSIEDQRRADERVPILLNTPSAVRWVSAEPLLGQMDIAWALSRNPLDIAAGFLARGLFAPGLETLRPLQQVIVGGESGPRARPMHPDWPRSLRDQCAAAGTAFLFKQWGEWAPLRSARPDDLLDARVSQILMPDGRVTSGLMLYPPDSWVMRRVGKRAAGRHLDGVLHDAYPEIG